MNVFGRMQDKMISLVFSGEAASITPTVMQRERNQIPEQYKWNLAEIYPTDDAWKNAKEQLLRQLPAIEPFRGKIGSSAQTSPPGVRSSSPTF